MRFKTHCPLIGELDFAVHSTEKALIAAIRHSAAWRATVTVLIEDGTTKSGWRHLARSFWRVDWPEGSVDTPYSGELPTEGDTPVRWILFSEDDSMEFLLCEVFGWAGSGPVITLSA